MKTMRHAAVLVFILGTALAGRAADRSGPAPSEIIYPRSASPEAGSENPGTEKPAAQRSSIPSINTSGSAFGYLVVLALLGGGAWLLMRRGALPRPFSKSEGHLKVLETRMLGNRQFLVVVEYEDAKMLLGVCQGRIDYLTPLAGHPLAAAAAEAAADEAAAHAQPPVFPNPAARR